jgi:DNA-binding transcriptional ArsR family regulator
MAMPMYYEPAGDARPPVVVHGSVAVEIDWVFSSASRPEFQRDHAVLARIYQHRPELVRRVRSFWGPGLVNSCGGSMELMILAHHGGLLLSLEPSELIGRLDELCRRAPAALALRGEDPDDRRVALGRLEALRSSSEVRARYIELVGDVWSAVSGDWERDGRSAVAGAVADRRALQQKGAAWREVAQMAPCTDENLIVSELIPSLGPDGLVAIVPAFFAHLGSLVDLPGTILIGVRADGSGAQARARTELLARRLRTVSDPTRLALIEALRADPRTVTELAGLFGLAQPTVSNHVKVLRDAGIVANGTGPDRRRLRLQPDVLVDLVEHLQGVLAVPETTSTR